MSHRAWKTVIVGVVTLSLAACQTTGIEPFGNEPNASDLTKDEQLLREQSDDFVAQNVFEGALMLGAMGCAAGAILGALLKRDAHDAAVGCAVGAAGGALLGGIDGYMNAKEAQHKSNEIAMLQSMTKDAQEENQKLEGLLETSRRVVMQNESALDELRRRVDTKQLTLERARDAAGRIQDNSKRMREVLDDAIKRRDNYSAAHFRMRSKNANTAEFDQQIANINKQISALEQQWSALNTKLETTQLGTGA